MDVSVLSQSLCPHEPGGFSVYQCLGCSMAFSAVVGDDAAASRLPLLLLCGHSYCRECLDAMPKHASAEPVQDLDNPKHSGSHGS